MRLYKHDHISCVSMLHKMGIDIGPICQIYHLSEENILYILQNYVLARKIWFDLDTPTDINYYEVPLSIWIKSNCVNNVNHSMTHPLADCVLFDDLVHLKK